MIITVGNTKGGFVPNLAISQVLPSTLRLTGGKDVFVSWIGAV
jgi:hypothetical protein